MSGQTDRTRDLAGGALLALIGLGAALQAQASLQIGTPANMGPGFFPVALGLCLALCGVGIVVTGVLRSIPAEDTPRINPRAIGLVTLSVALFALTVRPLGLIPAAFLLVMTAGFADPRSRWTTLALLAGGLALLSWLVFIVALRMPLQAFAL
ncbi:tripartite tricarboxylate transporter TctB family protein [Thalassovita sp.]|uniref:tripartite tricarboxylate transporter TctB family protein n=1 Tax=Thalassovita sp. TaxID=1979401 RepID=UPI0029DE75E4|nr:tripartite tricarboxylate transporter TctB family protein [Thalassovita sp.]